MTIHTLDTTKPKISNSPFAGLPDEASIVLASELAERAKKCGQAFKLEAFDWKKHQRVFCVGFNEGEEAIAVFYVSDTGVYAWVRLDHLYIQPDAHSTGYTSALIENGMNYWITPSNRGAGYYKAQVLGPSSDIGRRYCQLHQAPESKPRSPSNRKTKTDEDGNGAPPAYHPQDDFTPLNSLDELGL